ncbi:protein of unknown function [Pseudomonas sp. JV241A]|nr:protein of unknown function [Pseudomonas sp. JV241A]
MRYVRPCGWTGASLACTTCRTCSTCVERCSGAAARPIAGKASSHRNCAMAAIPESQYLLWELACQRCFSIPATPCRIPAPFRHFSGRPKKRFSVSYSFSVSTKSAQIIRRRKRGDVSIRHSAFLQPAIAPSG